MFCWLRSLWTLSSISPLFCHVLEIITLKYLRIDRVHAQTTFSKLLYRHTRVNMRRFWHTTYQQIKECFIFCTTLLGPLLLLSILLRTSCQYLNRTLFLSCLSSILLIETESRTAPSLCGPQTSKPPSCIRWEWDIASGSVSKMMALVKWRVEKKRLQLLQRENYVHFRLEISAKLIVNRKTNRQTGRRRERDQYKQKN